MKITYWSDYACPYCYIGEARLKKAIKDLDLKDVELDMRAFQLDPNAPIKSNGDTLTRFANKYGLSKDEAMERINDISKQGIDEGLDFKYATTLFTNTMDAHRLTKYVASKKDSKMLNKTIDELFKAYFSDNLELADKEVLINIGKKVGLNEEEITELLNSNQFEDDVRFDEREASMYGIHGVPFFLIDDVYAIPGAVSTKDMKDVLKKVKQKNKDNASSGHICGPDGCIL